MRASDARLADLCGHLLRRAQQWHNALWVAEVGDDCTTPQFAVLAALARYPQIDQRLLGEIISVDSSSAAELVRRLAARGWLTRRRSAEDARRNLLGLTEPAHRTLARLAPLSRRVQSTLLSVLPAESRGQLMAGLRLIAREPAGVADVSELDAPGHVIRVAQQVHTAIWAREFDGLLTGPQFAALHVLAGSPWSSQRHLAEGAGLDPSTAADIVGRLMRRGWIERRPDPDDGRGHLLALSVSAASLPGELWPRVVRVQELLLEPLSVADRPTFLGDLAQIAYRGSRPTEG